MNQGFVGTSSLVGSVTQFVGSRGQFTSALVEDDAPLSLTNNQKRSLSPSTPAGTRVSVSDGFVVSAATGDAIGVNSFYGPTGAENGKPKYTSSNGLEVVRWTPDTGWVIDDVVLGSNAFLNGYGDSGDVDYPWLVTSGFTPSTGGIGDPVITSPALQQLQSPSGAQRAVFVAGGTLDGIYTDRSDYDTLEGRKAFGLLGTSSQNDLDNQVSVIGWVDSRWVAFDAVGNPTYYSLSDVLAPDLAIPDTTAVRVAGGTRAGVYIADAGTWFRNGSGGAGSGSDIRKVGGSINGFYGSGPDAPGWVIEDGDGGLSYYSTQQTAATPDLVTNWKNASDDAAASITVGVSDVVWFNASDDSPASITVTSVSVAELNAGLFVTNDGVTNGSSYVSQPFHGRQYYMGLNGGGSNNMHWDTDYNVWTDDVGVWTTDNVAFPHQGRDNGGGAHTGATFAINHIPNEENWTNV